MLERLKAWLNHRNNRDRATKGPAKAELPAVTLHPFLPPGNCSRCGFNRTNGGQWDDAAQPHAETGLCSVRGFEITEPLTTYCKNFASRDHAPYGAVFAILPGPTDVCVPWVDLTAPKQSSATCCICGQQASPGILLTLPDGEVGACGPEHYFEWWTDYQLRRLDYFKALGEKAYSDMYEVVFAGATAHYSNAKEAFYSAIRTARDLELTSEVQTLNARLDHIKNIFRHQFK